MNGETQHQTGRGVRIALLVSLALNLLVVGAMAGAFLRKGGPEARMDRGPGASSYGMPYMRALSKDDRRLVGESIRARGLDRKEQRAVRRALFAEGLSALRADPFQPEALRAALEKQVAAATKGLQVSQEAWFDHVVAMTPQARAAYADRLEEGLNRRRKGKRDNR